TQFIAQPVSTNTFPYTTDLNLELNAITTRAQAKFLVQSKLPTATISTAPIKVQALSVSSSSANSLYDFSLSRIRSEHEQDPGVQQALREVRNEPDDQLFILQDGILYKLVSRGAIKIKVLYAPAKLIPELLAAHYDHPSSDHFGRLLKSK
ncbi:unnamed protein product, partial [Rotaria sp. Silwood2]